MRHEQLSTAIGSNAANAVQSIEDYAPVPARKTAEAIVLEFLVEFALFCVSLEDVLECR
jgi:hypothetical protein